MKKSIINPQSKSRRIKIFQYVIAIFAIFIVVQITQGEIASKARANSVKNLESRLTSLSSEFKNNGFAYSKLSDGTERIPRVSSNGDSCHDLDINGTSCQPPSVNVTLIGKSDNLLERTKIIEILKKQGFSGDQTLIDLFLGQDPNSIESLSRQPAYQLLLNDNEFPEDVFINIEYLNTEFYPREKLLKHSQEDGIASVLEINIYDFSTLKKREQQRFRERAKEDKQLDY